MQQSANTNFQQNPTNINMQQIPSNTNIQQQIPNSNFNNNFNAGMQQQPSNPMFQQQPSNPAFQQQPSNPAFQQQPSNPAFQQQPSNPMFQQQPSNPMFQQQPSNPAFQQQPSNPMFQQQPSNPTFQQQPSNPAFQQQPSNPMFQQQPSNPMFQQQPSNPTFQQQPSNPMFQQQPSNPTFQQQPSNPTFQQQPSNPTFQQQPSNPMFQQQPSNPTFQQQSSNPNLPQQQPNQPQHINSTFEPLPPNMNKRPKQTFAVFYNNTFFAVDPIALSNASPKFKELIEPYMEDYAQISELHLKIADNQFTKRNINNFLRICQKLPTDVKNSEMEQICEIAKMFHADDIYNKGIAFIHSSIDPNFNVPDNKYDGSDGINYLTIESETNVIQHENSEGSSSNAQNQSAQNESKQILNEESESTTANNEQNQNQNEVTIDGFGGSEHAVVYQVRVENHAIKCPVFKFVSDKQIIYTAKQKYNEIFFAEGQTIHIRDHTSHVAHIVQNETTKANSVDVRGQRFEIRYVDKLGSSTHFSVELNFQNKDTTLHWSPKPPRYDPDKDVYYLNFHGEYHHAPVLSSRNIVLQNDSGKSTFIVRKMTSSVYEIECLPVIDPLIAFVIGLSDIVGPYYDPWSSHQYIE